MRLYKLGEKSKAICPECEALKATTFCERNVPFQTEKGIVHNLLVAVCDDCDTVVGIPQQSTPRIKEALSYARQSLEVRIPRHIADALNLATHELGGEANQAAILVRAYILLAIKQKSTMGRLSLLAKSQEASGKATARFSAKLKPALMRELGKLRKLTGLKNADLVKAAILAIKEDVLDKNTAKRRAELQAYLAVS